MEDSPRIGGGAARGEERHISPLRHAPSPAKLPAALPCHRGEPGAFAAAAAPLQSCTNAAADPLWSCSSNGARWRRGHRSPRHPRWPPARAGEQAVGPGASVRPPRGFPGVVRRRSSGAALMAGTRRPCDELL